MNEKLDLNFILNDSRCRVYLLWAVLTGIGFTGTHFYQNHYINGVWFILSAIGLGYMYKVMPLRDKRMKKIFAAWLIPIALGLAVSGAVFYVSAWSGLIQYLGAFWLAVMAIGYFCNGLVDAPSEWYWIAVGLNVVAAVACFRLPTFTLNQYLIAAVISVWSMLNLWLFRTDI